jgi:EAL domain-containing protein (putative c-di-GMP-specific phosphodiesterase class I)
LREPYSYEALIRGPAGESAATVFARVSPTQAFQFDRDSRLAAVVLAGRLHVPCSLNLNVLPQSMMASAVEREALMDGAAQSRIARERLILEVTENEAIRDRVRFAAAVDTFREYGVKIAIDDFGAGYAGLNMLADFQPDVIKLDMSLVRSIESSGPRQAIARAIIQVCVDLGIDLIAEGVETLDEFHWFADEGVRLYQGYLFAKPGFECLPSVRYP